MSIDLTRINNFHRLLFEIPLIPLQGHRFQPTGFPSLGAATFETSKGTNLLVESTQSMANRLELTIWNGATRDLISSMQGLSHVRVWRMKDQEKQFLTDTIIESHRLSSPYVLDGTNSDGLLFFDVLAQSFREFDKGFFNRKYLMQEILRLDIGSLIHGVFMSQKRNKTSLASGRLRVSRALSAFIEASGVRIASSGGVKNDHVNPSWPKTKVAEGYGNVPFHRDEYTAEKITLFVNIDLAQIRGYGFREDVEELLILLSLYKLRSLINQGHLDLRTNCDLKVDADPILSSNIKDFELPELSNLLEALGTSIDSCKAEMVVTDLMYNQKIEKGSEDEGEEGDETDTSDSQTDEV